jgi:glycosyltransferase involved in cell wall biosynthesis
MCTYNGERFVEAQLESILNQTRVPDEIILCDDVSTDSTVDRARKIAGKSSITVHIIQNEKNLRYLKNFESAISRTTGDVIFLSDQDDFWFPDKVATMMVPFAQNPEVVLAYSDALLTDGELRPTGDTVFGRRKGMQLQNTPTVRQLGRGVGFNGPVLAFHSRLKPLILPISPLSEQWGHDHWISFLAYAVGETRVIDRPLLYYRRHGKNIGGDAEFDGGLRHQWQVVKKIYAGPKEYGERRRGWEDMAVRLREIKNSGSPLPKPERLDELLREAELCLEFAEAREALKKRKRWARLPLALRFLLGGDYRRHARGLKSLVQDVVIP